MSTHWQTKKLGEVCEVIAGQSPEGKFYNTAGKGLSFYQGKKEFTEKYIGTPSTWTTKTTKETEPGDILMSVRAPVGPVNFVTQKVCIGRGLAAIRAGKDIDKDYLFDYLGYIEQEICGNAGAVFASISKKEIENIEIPLPPLPEQRRIVKILDEVFAGVGKAKENAEKNLKNSRELFESYLQGVFVHPGKNTLVEIGSVAKIFDGPHATPKTITEGPVFLGISALHDGAINLEQTRHVSAEDFQRWTRRVQPFAGDVVFSYETRLGQAGIIPEGLECCLGRRMGLVRIDQTKLDPRYFLYQYISSPFREFLKSRTVKGATVDRISIKEFPSFLIQLPPLPEQRAIVAKLDALSAETKRLEVIYRHKIADLDELKRSVLKKAFAGEI